MMNPQCELSITILVIITRVILEAVASCLPNKYSGRNNFCHLTTIMLH